MKVEKLLAKHARLLTTAPRKAEKLLKKHARFVQLAKIAKDLKNALLKR